MNDQELIQQKLERLEQYNKGHAQKVREVMAISKTIPIIVQNGPFRGWVQVNIQRETIEACNLEPSQFCLNGNLFE